MTTIAPQRTNLISITYLGLNGRWWFCICRECLMMHALIAALQTLGLLERP